MTPIALRASICRSIRNEVVAELKKNIFLFERNGYLVENHGLVGKVNERFGDAESQRP